MRNLLKVSFAISSLSLVTAACRAGGFDVDTFLGVNLPTEEVQVASVNDLNVTITRPANDGAPAGYQKVLAGTCGTVAKVIKVTGDATGLAICGSDKTWSTTVNFVGAPTGSVRVEARLIDDTYNLVGNPAVRYLNRISNACDSSAARADTYANFSTGGDGNATPWIVCTSNQWANINLNRADKFELHNDIDFGGSTINAIASSFTGSLEGHEFELSDFSISSTTTRMGLFRQIDGGVTLQNIYIRDAVIEAQYEAGALVGYINTGDNTIENVHAENVTITTTHGTSGSTGGLIGRNQGSGNTVIRNVSVSGLLSIDSKDNVGGIVGYLANGAGTMLVENAHVYASGTIAGRNQVGGVIGYNVEDSGSITDISAVPSVSGAASVGGAIGRNDGAPILQARASGNVSSSGGNYIGGLVGYNRLAAGTVAGTLATATRDPSVDPEPDCYAKGNVSAGSSQYVGGLIGRNESGDLIEHCYATGNVSGGINFVGGLIGDSSAGDVLRDVYATGNVSGAEDYVGGLVGRAYNGVITIEDCYATGSVISAGLTATYVGGAFGQLTSNTTAQNCFAKGNVSAVDNDGSGTVQYIGGFAGYAGNAGITLTDISAEGDVLVESLGGTVQYIGGAFGYLRNNCLRCESSGDISAPTAINVGGLAGYVYQNTIDESNWEGSSITADSTVGGLVGYLRENSALTLTYAKGSITAISGQVGGLVGNARGNIDSSFVIGSVTGGADYVGGIDGGNNYDQRWVTESFFMGSVDGGTASYVGGITGYVRPRTDRFVDNFSAGSVRGGDYVGGVVGYLLYSQVNGATRNYSSAQVIRASGAAGADADFGPVYAGSNNWNGVLINTSYYNVSTVPVDEVGSVVIAAHQTSRQSALSNGQMQNQAFFNTFDFTAGTGVWSAPTSLTIPGFGSFLYPTHQWYVP